jgi:hypothetical protein
MGQRRRHGRPDIPYHRHAEQQRWADYAQRVAAHGVMSSLSVPLPFQSAIIGALNRRKASCAMWPQSSSGLAHCAVDADARSNQSMTASLCQKFTDGLMV